MVRWLQLAHDERNKRGVPVARVIHNLSREDLDFLLSCSERVQESVFFSIANLLNLGVERADTAVVAAASAPYAVIPVVTGEYFSSTCARRPSSGRASGS